MSTCSLSVYTDICSKTVKHTFLFLKQFKTVDTKTQICAELETVGFARKHVALVDHLPLSPSTADSVTPDVVTTYLFITHYK